MKSKRTTLALAALAAVLALPRLGDAKVYLFCDPYKSDLCVALSQLYEFEEAAGVNRESETPAQLFTEPEGTTTGRTATHKTGTYALAVTAGTVGLEKNPFIGLGGEYSGSLWVRPDTIGDLPSAGTTWGLVGVRRVDSGGAGGYPYLGVFNNSGTYSVVYVVKQALTDNAATLTNTPSAGVIAGATWFHVAWGQYPNPDYPNGKPFQWTLWSSVNGAAKATTNVDYPPTPTLGRLELASTAGSLVTRNGTFDQLAFWGGTFSPANIAEIYNSGNGKAFPFTN